MKKLFVLTILLFNFSIIFAQNTFKHSVSAPAFILPSGDVKSQLDAKANTADTTQMWLYTKAQVDSVAKYKSDSAVSAHAASIGNLGRDSRGFYFESALGYKNYVTVRDSSLIPNWSGLRTGTIHAYIFNASPVLDLVGSNNGTLSGGASISGDSVVFAGSTFGVVDFGTGLNANLLSDFTITCQIYLTNDASEGQVIYNLYYPNGYSFGISLRYQASSHKVYVVFSGNATMYGTTNSIYKNNWYTVTITHVTGGNTKIYVDGSLQSAASQPTSLTSSYNGKFVVGGFDFNSTYPMYGAVKNLQILNVVWTDAQVAAHHNSGNVLTYPTE